MSPKREPTKDPEIVRYPSGVYYYRGTPPGEKIRVEESLGTKIFKDAKANKRKLLREIEDLGLAAAKNKFEPAALKYLIDRMKDVKRGDIRQSTYEETETMIKTHLIPFFSSYSLAEIDNPLFHKYMKKKGRLNFANHRKILSRFLRWARDEKLIKFAPELTIPKQYKKESRQRAVLTVDELESILSNADGDLFLYIAMYLFMGMRRGEIIKLEWSRVDLKNAVITLEGQHTKTNKGREVPINSVVLDLLKARFKNAENKKWVFPAPRQQTKDPHLSVSGFRKKWAKLMVDAEIERHLTPHDLRATWEKYTHSDTSFTDTQREKMAGASIDVQKRIYVSMKADDYRGLAEAVKFKGMDKILRKKSEKNGGNRGGNDARKRTKKALS